MHKYGTYCEAGHPRSWRVCELDATEEKLRTIQKALSTPTLGPSDGPSPPTTSSPPSNASACARSKLPSYRAKSSELQNQDTRVKSCYHSSMCAMRSKAWRSLASRASVSTRDFVVFGFSERADSDSSSIRFLISIIM